MNTSQPTRKTGTILSFLIVFIALCGLSLGGWYWYSSQNNTPEGPEIIERSVPVFSQQYPTLINEPYSIDNPVFIMDIRDREKYNAGHLRGAFSLPYTVLQSGGFQLPQNKRVILVTGEQKPNYTVLRRQLNNYGLEQVEIITEPYDNWSSQLPQDTGNPLLGEEEIVE